MLELLCLPEKQTLGAAGSYKRYKGSSTELQSVPNRLLQLTSWQHFKRTATRMLFSDYFCEHREIMIEGRGKNQGIYLYQILPHNCSSILFSWVRALLLNSLWMHGDCRWLFVYVSLCLGESRSYRQKILKENCASTEGIHYFCL